MASDQTKQDVRTGEVLKEWRDPKNILGQKGF